MPVLCLNERTCHTFLIFQMFELHCRYKIPVETPLAGTLNTRGGKIAIFTVYLGNGTR